MLSGNPAMGAAGGMMVFVGSLGGNGNVTLRSKGALPGDIAIGGSGGGWQQMISVGSASASVFPKWKRLQSADLDLVSQADDRAHAGTVIGIWRGNCNQPVGRVADSEESPIDEYVEYSQPGFVKSPGHTGLAFYSYSQAGGAFVDVSAPATITARDFIYQKDASNNDVARRVIYDRLYPANPIYIDGTRIGFAANGPHSVAVQCIEFVA